MKNISSNNLFSQFISFENFHSAFQKAKKLKNLHSDVLKFEYNFERYELAMEKTNEIGKMLGGMIKRFN